MQVKTAVHTWSACPCGRSTGPCGAGCCSPEWIRWGRTAVLWPDPAAAGFMRAAHAGVEHVELLQMEVTLKPSDPLWSSPSSYTLLEALAETVGFMLEIPWRLSCSNIPGTARRESGLTRRRKGKCIITYLLYFHTDHGKERVLHHADELMVDVDGEVAENLAGALKGRSFFRQFLFWRGGLCFMNSCWWRGKWTISFQEWYSKISLKVLTYWIRKESEHVMGI